MSFRDNGERNGEGRRRGVFLAAAFLFNAHETHDSSTGQRDPERSESKLHISTAASTSFQNSQCQSMRLPALAGAFACSVTLLLPLGLSVLRASRGRFEAVGEKTRPARPSPTTRPRVPGPTTRSTPNTPKPSTTTTRPPFKTLFPVLKAFDGSVINRAAYRQDFGQLSRKNKAIFVHVPKTGGSTIEDSRLFEDAQKFHNTKGHSEAEVLTLDAFGSCSKLVAECCLLLLRPPTICCC